MDLDSSTYHELCTEVGCILHCAGNTSFSDKNKSESLRDNIDALQNVLDFCRNSHCQWFHLISTIYSKGDKTGIIEETIDNSGLFTNIYEKMKYQGELITLEYCKQNNIKATIIRPSIVIGSSQTGKTFRFNGLYYPIKALILIRDMFLTNILSGDGKRAQKMSITYENGKVHIPLRFESNPDEGINLLPVDFVAEAINAIIENPHNRKIYNLAAKNYVTISELIEFTGRFFGITGLSTVKSGYFSNNKKNSLERLFDGYIEPYWPYIKDKRKFQTNNTDCVLDSLGITYPTFDYTMYSRCMEYALRTKWGKTLQFL